MNCPRCKATTKVMRDTIDGASYEYHRCITCGEEVLDLRQFKQVAAHYRRMRDARDVTFARWGNSLAVRVPKEMTDALSIREGTRGLLIREKDGIRIVRA